MVWRVFEESFLVWVRVGGRLGVYGVFMGVG